MSQTTKHPPAPGPRPTDDDLALRRTDRRVRRAVLGVVLGLLAVLAAVGALAGRGSDSVTAQAGGATSRAVPRGVDPATLAVPVAPGVTAKEGAPDLYVWEDFQCPSCAQAEKATGERIVALARSGDISAYWRVTTFLDRRLPGDSSLRAAAAWGCAIDAGRAVEYHAALFAAQPAVEGTGFSDAQLLRTARGAGVRGSDYSTFRRCVADGRYRSWATRSTSAFYAEGVPGTPTGVLDGHTLDPGTLADPVALTRALDDARTERGGG